MLFLQFFTVNALIFNFDPQIIIDDASHLREPYHGIDPAVIEQWIAPWEQGIHDLNTWIDRPEITSGIHSLRNESSLVLNLPQESHQRKMIYEYLNNQYPYLQTELVKVDDSIYKLKIGYDVAYVDLWNILQIQDVKTLYQFKNQPIPDQREKGIIIGILSI